MGTKSWKFAVGLVARNSTLVSHKPDEPNHLAYISGIATRDDNDDPVAADYVVVKMEFML